MNTETVQSRTTFVPKQPVGQDHRQKRTSQTDIFSILTIVILFGAIATWGGFFYYNQVLAENINEKRQEIEDSQSTLDPENILIDLNRLENKLDTAREIFQSHNMVSPIIALISDVTLTNSILYSDFNYLRKEGVHIIDLRGAATSFASLAYQAQLFENHEDIIDPVFTGVSVDEKNGLVSFDISFSINPEIVRYGSLRNVVSDEEFNKLFEELDL